MPPYRDSAPKVITYSTMISVCEKAWQWTDALHLLHSMPSDLKVGRPNTGAWNAARAAPSGASGAGSLQSLCPETAEARGCCLPPSEPIVDIACLIVNDLFPLLLDIFLCVLVQSGEQSVNVSSCWWN